MTASFSFPVRHISIRVPWHDAGWTGTVCLDPKHNAACLKLKNIAERKDEAAEARLVGKHFKDLAPEETPPCLRERVSFMSPFAFERRHQHPYRRDNTGPYGHFKPTLLRYPAYSAPALPFRWFMKSEAVKSGGDLGLVDQYPLEQVDLRLEPDLGFKTNWIQDHRNQTAMSETFWAHVQPEGSLVFFYAKQVPLVDDMPGRRVLVGVGRVKSKGPIRPIRSTARLKASYKAFCGSGW